MNVVLKKDGEVVVPCVECAFSLPARMRGLLWRSLMPPGRALWLSPCGAVHTFGMRFDLDLVFIDAEFTVVRIVFGVRPCRMVSGGWRARSVIELQAGSLPLDLLAVGDRVELI